MQNVFNAAAQRFDDATGFFQLGAQQRAACLGKRANRARHRYRVGNHIVNRTAVDRANRDYARVKRVEPAADDVLDGVNHMRRQGNWVDSALRARGVAARATDRQFKHIRRRQHRTPAGGDRAHFMLRVHMQPEDSV